MKKKLALILAAVIAMSAVTGCGDKKETGTDATNSTTVSEVSNSDAETTVAESESDAETTVAESESNAEITESESNAEVTESTTTTTAPVEEEKPQELLNLNDGTLVIAKGILINGTGAEGEIIVPDGVISIGNNAFINNQNITAITLPDGVTSIGYGAFQECTGLTSVTIPDSVTSIDDVAFQGCENVTITYKGNTYIYDNIDDLYTAING